MSFAQDGPRRTPMAEINVTPLVDVVLVLLIIFMVTAPFLTAGLDIQLPKVSAQGLDLREGLTLTIDPNGAIRLDQAPVTLAGLEDALNRRGAASRPVYVRADQHVPYGVVAQVIGRAREAGVTNIGLVTEPDERKRK